MSDKAVPFDDFTSAVGLLECWLAMVEVDRELAGQPPLKGDEVAFMFMGNGGSVRVHVNHVRDIIDGAVQMVTMTEGLQAIKSRDPAHQLAYLAAIGVTPYEPNLAEYEWQGDHEADARHTFPAKLRLISEVAQAALAVQQ